MRKKTFKARNFFDGGIFDSKIIQSLGGKGDKKLRSEKFQDFFKDFWQKVRSKKMPKKMVHFYRVEIRCMNIIFQ